MNFKQFGLTWHLNFGENGHEEVTFEDSWFGAVFCD